MSDPTGSPTEATPRRRGPSPLPAARWQRIEEVLAQRGLVGTNELAQLTGVSAVTMRRDLDALTESGVLVRTRGGARLVKPRRELDEAFTTREGQMADEKRRIAVAAVNCLRPGEALGMNDGTTVMQVAQQITSRQIPLTVATNALNIALALVDSEFVEVTVVGGLLRRVSFGTYAPTEDALGHVRFDTVVLGIAGMDSATGIAMQHPFDSVSARRFIDRARRVIVVADSSKWNVSGYAHLAGWDEVDALVTDRSPPQALSGTEVIVAAD
jgi:DeoR family transcriptional regulator, aga operon transcriptional repressor